MHLRLRRMMSYPCRYEHREQSSLIGFIKQGDLPRINVEHAPTCAIVVDTRDDDFRSVARIAGDVVLAKFVDIFNDVRLH